jgi:hypothetical protein
MFAKSSVKLVGKSSKDISSSFECIKSKSWLICSFWSFTVAKLELSSLIASEDFKDSVRVRAVSMT